MFSPLWSDEILLLGTVTVRKEVAKSGRSRILALFPRSRTLLRQLYVKRRGEFVFERLNGARYSGNSTYITDSLIRASKGTSRLSIQLHMFHCRSVGSAA